MNLTYFVLLAYAIGLVVLIAAVTAKDSDTWPR